MVAARWESSHRQNRARRKICVKDNRGVGGGDRVRGLRTRTSLPGAAEKERTEESRQVVAMPESKGMWPGSRGLERANWQARDGEWKGGRDWKLGAASSLEVWSQQGESEPGFHMQRDGRWQVADGRQAGQ
ncbi:hypothetical protein E4U21_007937 [Claviceps maximensis]|nr:hypothetical protein E4U21_007937 [Claviceps maximensis]